MTSEEKEQLDIQYLYRGENLWQFRIAEHTPDYHTKSFSDSGRHSDASLQEARKYRNAFFDSIASVVWFLNAGKVVVPLLEQTFWLQLPTSSRGKLRQTSTASTRITD